MNLFSIFFKYPINTSVQEGDTAHYVSTTGNFTAGGFTLNSSASPAPTKLGKIVKIQPMDTNDDNNWDTVEIEIDLITDDTPNIGDFIMFSKSRQANVSSSKGYYAEVRMNNDSKEPAELFTVGCEVVGSS